ncbi:hypothetical protein [Streptomyces sp. AA0539]|uniref:hypothetical protein n=1 Tax=Streptomyces sp. AA0539 TaxID=1210045 RepID=UPI0002DD32F5|nr:hypothetical protein [Streptomyces sp. AA0539]
MTPAPAEAPPTGASRSLTLERELILRTHAIHQLDAATGQALLLADHLPPALVELPPLSDDPDWPAFQADITRIRHRADIVRAEALRSRAAERARHHAA